MADTDWIVDRPAIPGRLASWRMPMGSPTEFAKAYARRLFKAHELHAICIRPALSAARHVAILVVHNEADRMAAFLAHHRALGFDHFIIIDNQSDDSLRDDVGSMDDVSLFSASGAFSRARYGNDWVNTVLSRYCRGKWILYVDADEHFVFAHSDRKSIAALTAFLDAEGRESLPCVLVDMYSDRPVTENICRRGQNPLEICDLYDRDGYVERLNLRTNVAWIKGGVRGRLFFRDRWKGPALNKTPLVRWRRSYAFLKSAHELYPPRANERLDEPYPLRGALLHFKFLSSLPALLTSEVQRQQHTTEYKAYDRLCDDAQDATRFVGPPTARYRGWQSLASDGLIVGTDWPDRPSAGHPRSVEAAAG